ncbi:MAG: PEP-CTERM sorting domain-containing protein [Bryobacterales bacterium]|nr:PEP-CTERM sorting domain-containing protein [Bryobacterales bacterium]
MPSRCIFTLGALVLGVVFTAPAAVVGNGGFESGNLTGWTLSNASSFDTVCQSGNPIGSATCAANSGSYAMTFGSFGSVASLSQSIVTTNGQAYDVSFSLSLSAATPTEEETFEVLWGGVSVFSLANPGAAFGYSPRVVLNLLANSSSMSLEFRARNDPGQWFLDDVAIADTSVPEPASVALTALGLAGAALVHHRRRRTQA